MPASALYIYRRMASHFPNGISLIISGCYVASANRIGQTRNGPQFGGAGLVFSATGELSAQTSVAHSVVTADLDLFLTRRQMALYPCYVVDRSLAAWSRRRGAETVQTAR